MTDYGKMFIMMEKYVFNTLEFDSLILNYLKCVICNKLLIDAFEGPCGCNYCKSCIINYLNGDEKLCVGLDADCKVQKLCMNKNVNKSYSLDRKISGLQVNCPLESCEYYTCMLDMSDHIMMCDQLPVNCPYCEMGCMSESIKKGQLSQHLYKEINLHNNLLVKWILDIKSDSIKYVKSFDSKLLRIVNNYDKENQENIQKMMTMSSEIAQLREKNNELAAIIETIKEKERTDIMGLGQFLQIARPQTHVALNDDGIPKKKRKKIIDKQIRNGNLTIDSSGTPINSTSAENSWENPRKLVANYTWDTSGKVSFHDEEKLEEKFISIDGEYEISIILTPRKYDNRQQLNVIIQLICTYCPGNQDRSRTVQLFATITMRNKTFPSAYQTLTRFSNFALSTYFPTKLYFLFDFAELTRNSVLLNSSVLIECTVTSECPNLSKRQK